MSQPLSGVSLPPFPKNEALARREAHAQPKATPTAAPVPTPWTVRRTRAAEAPRYALRSYNVMWSADNGDILDRKISAPALPAFEGAFNAFARGALIPTEHGPVAVEDLLPGDNVVTTNGEVLSVSWIGSMPLDLTGARQEGAAPEKLYRITADTFGLGRPAPDLMLGEGARYLHRADRLKSYLGASEALAPVPALADGVSVFEVTPPSAVRCYHFCLTKHALVRVNGVELETYHPGSAASGQLGHTVRQQFMGLFPHLTDLGGFGAVVLPRLSRSDLLALDAA